MTPKEGTDLKRRGVRFVLRELKKKVEQDEGGNGGMPRGTGGGLGESERVERV